MGIARLPEGCISHILSLTSPADAARSAACCRAFRSAAESDAVWERFLPPDYGDILTRAVEPVSYVSKKDLYMRLSDHPLLIDAGRKSFMLARLTGKKCYMLSAKELLIAWDEGPRYWRWVSLPESRFAEVAELRAVCYLEVRGKIDTSELSPKTTYVGYLVFKVTSDASGLHFPPQEASISIGGHSYKQPVCLVPMKRPSLEDDDNEMEEGDQHRELTPEDRSDGWKEIALGEFFIQDGSEGEVDISLIEAKGGHWKRGLVVMGIEIRCKN